MEASIEHLSRGTIRNVDTLLIVVEPYYRAMETAGRIAALAPHLGIPSMLAIANKVRADSDEGAIRSYCEAHSLEVSTILPADERIVQCDREGGSFLDFAPDSQFVAGVAALADRLTGAAVTT